MGGRKIPYTTPRNAGGMARDAVNPNEIISWGGKGKPNPNPAPKPKGMTAGGGPSSSKKMPPKRSRPVK